ncbi:hypothetical protein BDF20DRAFT_987912 [Mycotypha africana]|uniref:uncharacterized protein n=1 Tax=Mycotypha africana TaxID=64632 RepID=UPI002300B427|nr:uncharacterized protein BDF20DRAFT_987912 [Mycotypha africana]KAI8979714.1 hypothetical protein BDF20DRAFT_987912 [Mycotypha africana]
MNNKVLNLLISKLLTLVLSLITLGCHLGNCRLLGRVNALYFQLISSNAYLAQPILQKSNLKHQSSTYRFSAIGPEPPQHHSIAHPFMSPLVGPRFSPSNRLATNCLAFLPQPSIMIDGIRQCYSPYPSSQYSQPRELRIRNSDKRLQLNFSYFMDISSP